MAARRTIGELDTFRAERRCVGCVWCGLASYAYMCASVGELDSALGVLLNSARCEHGQSGTGSR